ncbi:AB hydrolase superfamily protein C4A8.06c [Grifola frondosa]|uniref:AB hydrolase superfamily protein C4A8.06c n=1 Tax=Grifola frondosa TaxID=5627 RepID=A0A1C7M0E9_GRIFR|nr:AB hydrolase superfamily protein C4A8.06c [Grifola frondosa]
MPVNSLTRQAGLRLGPILLETLVKHYFDRLSKDHESEQMPKLRKDELLYDEAFIIIKTFMEAATKHTVEELQGFSNTRTPSPPWVHAVRLLVPVSCCDEAAALVIQVLGGEEMTKRLVGGTKWWQVRGVKGIDAEWIVAKKHWEDAKRKQKAHEKDTSGANSANAESVDGSGETPASYQPEMDEMRCILYAHGGGYYFGSIDQERYCIQRFARKINGRVFAINYRLAPQYPFPCAIQDFLAAYLYLIRPPKGALHRPVKPEHIVFSGDSAGGGLCIALLQVVRDTGLPLPAGAVLISPWCDLTHSFPSVHLNTATDIIPPYGLSFHKPSTLWPPPPDELTTQVHEGIRSRIRQAMHRSKDSSPQNLVPPKSDSTPAQSEDYNVPINSAGRTLHSGVSLQTATGETLAIDGQVHMYAPNYLLGHPLVSPVVSYLGGLPPLLVIASDKEVIRDEILYFAHKAAHPDKYPVKEEARRLYPILEGIEKRHAPTNVHLQVYDDTAHTLPVLFSFTTPAKYCFRAMAIFCKYVTGILPPAENFTTAIRTLSPSSSASRLATSDENGAASLMPPIPHAHSTPSIHTPDSQRARSQSDVLGNNADGHHLPHPSNKSMRRALSASVSTFLRRNNGRAPQVSESSTEDSSSDVAGPRFHEHQRFRPSRSGGSESGYHYAGEASVYDNGLDTMIRERVSTRGVVRPLEAEGELPAFLLPPALIGVISELAVRRYLDGNAKFTKKFSKTSKSIEKKRQRNLDLAHKDTVRSMAQLQMYLQQEDGQDPDTSKGIKEGLAASGSWSLAWALDEDEHPPPSSIVSRRDTGEARRLAKIADQAVLMDDHTMSGNNLWSLIVNFLTVPPDHHHAGHRDRAPHEGPHRKHEHATNARQEKHRSRFAQFVSQHKKARSSDEATKEH